MNTVLSQLDGLAGKGDYFQGWQLLFNITAYMLKRNLIHSRFPTDLFFYTGMYMHIHTANNQTNK